VPISCTCFVFRVYRFLEACDGWLLSVEHHAMAKRHLNFWPETCCPKWLVYDQAYALQCTSQVAITTSLCSSQGSRPSVPA